LLDGLSPRPEHRVQSSDEELFLKLTSIERFTNWHIAFKALLFARLGMLAFAVPHAPAQIYQQPAPFAWSLPQIPTGTVMVSTYNGKITEFNQTGTMLGQLDTTTGSLEGGSILEFLRYRL
jgi:hypothetical protein